MSGFLIFQNDLRKRIKAGMNAIFVIGIDFYQSEPIVLKELLKIKKNLGGIEIYMGTFERKWIFHPKLYLFESSNESSAIVGSANMTSGGLANNHELSIVFDSGAIDLGAQVRKWMHNLSAHHEIIEATNATVEEYERRHLIYSLHMITAQRQAERATTSQSGGIETLSEVLHKMKIDNTDYDFEASIKQRRSNLKRGLIILKKMALSHDVDDHGFLDEYERLIATMHSSGFHRGKNTVARSSAEFRKGVRSLLKVKVTSRNPAVLFEHLKVSFEDVKGAGTNIITEILHLLDPQRYAVMNGNSVSGMVLAGISNFPEHPTKRQVNGVTYALFCTKAKAL